MLAAKDSGLLVAGGGHAMAAGLTIAADRLDALRAISSRSGSPPTSRARSATRALLLDARARAGRRHARAGRRDGGRRPLWHGLARAARRRGAGADRSRPISSATAMSARSSAGDDGRSLKAVAFRQAETALGQALLGAPPHRRLWLAGRAKIDDWGARPAAELHLDDAAWAD